MERTTAETLLDRRIMSILPTGTKIVSCRPFEAGWIDKLRLTVRMRDGSIEDYMVKQTSTAEGSRALKGQYFALQELAKMNPILIPRPITYKLLTLEENEDIRTPDARGERGQARTETSRGQRRAEDRDEQRTEREDRERETGERKREDGEEPFKDQHDVSFLVMDFLVISKTLPDPEVFCAQIAAIHRNSVSPHEHEFGFPTYSYQAKFSQPVKPDSNWARFFGNLLTDLCEFESSMNGLWLKSEFGFWKLVERTVPRLLGALQAGGRQLKPCLVHGNLSISNIGINIANGEPVVINPAALYAHNEYELGMWRRKLGTLAWPYFLAYQKHFPPAEPVDQWDDRIRLYSIRFNLAYLLTAPGTVDVQRQISEDIDYLNNKYG